MNQNRQSYDCAPAESQGSGGRASVETIRERVEAVIDKQINPAVAMHGGFVSLVDVQGTKVYVLMGGGCHGCAASSMTLRMGIEAMIMEEVPEVTEVLDSTDHATGTNPYLTG